MLALETGACIDIQHISSGNAVDFIRYAKSIGVKVFAEATPHHFTLTEDDVLEHGVLAKMNPPLRSTEDRERIIAGLIDDTIEIIATDHALILIRKKMLPLPRLLVELLAWRLPYHLLSQS